jgi:two-component system, OmpR family, phosphate regulon response regulator PhoB
MTSARVLIVEDEASLGVMLRYNLEAAQYQVDIADRGDEAEIRISENPPDLIVS